MPNQPKPYARPKKRCWCTSTCGKLLTAESRRRHYNNLTLEEYKSKGDSESEDSEERESTAPRKSHRSHSRLCRLDYVTSNYPLIGASGSQDGGDTFRVNNHIQIPDSASQVGTSSADLDGMDEDDDYGLDSKEHQKAHCSSSAHSEQIFLDSDSELIDGKCEIDPDLVAWMTYDEDTELTAMTSVDERLKEFDEILNSGAASFKEAWEGRNGDLSPQDLDDIQAFKLRVVCNMPRRAFDQMRHAFQHKMQISSLYVITQKLAIISGINPVYYDCCPNSCLAYVGQHKDEDCCPLCNTPRYNQYHQPRRMFCYVPLIPRLQKFFANPSIVEELSYRCRYKRTPNYISDVFDGIHYQNLKNTIVTIDNEPLDHYYFSGENDIAFSVCLDSYLLYKRRRNGPSAMPIVLQIYNLPPETRTHLARLICLGVIPGPRSPKDLHSFLFPFEEECGLLARGVNTFHSIKQQLFPLHAYHLFPHGDMVAIEKLLNIKGHNGLTPCRGCKIKAVNNPNGDSKTYYVPLVHPGGKMTSNSHNPSPREHGDWAKATSEIANESTEKGKDDVAKFHGIKGMPALGRVGSIDYARGFPWDFMHLLFENVVKNLVNLWMGRFKGLDAGVEDYIIPAHIWTEIGVETTSAIQNIPAAFVRSLGNIANEQGGYTAEGWAFWFIYLAPILLKGRLDSKYYNHFMQLVKVIKTCIKFSLSYQDIDDLEEDIISWVLLYERFYYQYNAERLSVCTLTIHGLLHLPDNIRFCGPVWTTWTFWMERYCGFLQASLRSHVHPWTNLNKRVLHKAYLEVIDMVYGLKNESPLKTPEREINYPSYPLAYLRGPHIRNFTPDKTLRKRVATYFSLILTQTPNTSKNIIEKALPQIMSSWGRLRIGSGGDSIRTSSASRSLDKDRNMSFVRYEVAFRNERGQIIQHNIHYGELHLILECCLDDQEIWEERKGKQHLLAVITPCKTTGKDATKLVTEYTKSQETVVTDLQAVQCVVGRVCRRKIWGIINRSMDEARPECLSQVEGTRRIEKNIDSVDSEDEFL